MPTPPSSFPRSRSSYRLCVNYTVPHRRATTSLLCGPSLSSSLPVCTAVMALKAGDQAKDRFRLRSENKLIERLVIHREQRFIILARFCQSRWGKFALEEMGRSRRYMEGGRW